MFNRERERLDEGAEREESAHDHTWSSVHEIERKGKEKGRSSAGDRQIDHASICQRRERWESMTVRKVSAKGDRSIDESVHVHTYVYGVKARGSIRG